MNRKPSSSSRWARWSGAPASGRGRSHGRCAAGEHRRDGEVHLVDDAGIEQRAVEPGAALHVGEVTVEAGAGGEEVDPSVTGPNGVDRELGRVAAWSRRSRRRTAKRGDPKSSPSPLRAHRRRSADRPASAARTPRPARCRRRRGRRRRVLPERTEDGGVGRVREPARSSVDRGRAVDARHHADARPTAARRGGGRLRVGVGVERGDVSRGGREQPTHGDAAIVPSTLRCLKAGRSCRRACHCSWRIAESCGQVGASSTALWTKSRGSPVIHSVVLYLPTGRTAYRLHS